MKCSPKSRLLQVTRKSLPIRVRGAPSCAQHAGERNRQFFEGALFPSRLHTHEACTNNELMTTRPRSGPLRILSGGQTGVDRAALDVAIELGIEHGGWCPRGRRAEDGRIDDCYQLRETDASEYHIRTEMNVEAADATLILTAGPLTGGTRLTEIFAARHGRPYRVVDLDQPIEMHELRHWLEGFEVLNIAGPRESSQPGIYARAGQLLRTLLAGQKRT